MVSKESECVCPMSKDSTAPPYFSCRSFSIYSISKDLELLSTERRCKASVKKIERSPTARAGWIEVKEALAKFQAASGNETSDDKGSDDMTSKAERKRKSDASPVEFCHRILAGGNMWESLPDSLKSMQLREVGANDEKEVTRT